MAGVYYRGMSEKRVEDNSLLIPHQNVRIEKDGLYHMMVKVSLDEYCYLWGIGGVVIDRIMNG